MFRRMTFVLFATSVVAVALLTATSTPAEEKPALEPGPPAAEEAIRQALAQPAELAFKQVPLHAVLDFLGTRHTVQVVVDVRALEDSGLTGKEKVTCSVEGVKLKSALDLMLEPMGLTWIIRDEVLVITTREVADVHLTNQVYPVADLVVTRGPVAGVEEEVEDHDALYDALTSTIAPGSWTDAGGPGSMQPFRRTLLISQTPRIHEQFTAVLRGLRQARDQQKQPGPKRYAAVRGYDGRAEDKVLATMRRPVTLEFVKTPLGKALDLLAGQFGLQIHLDRRELEDVGVNAIDTLVNIKVADVSLKSALKLMLEELELTWIVKHDVLMITTADAAAEHRTTWVYPIADLLREEAYHEDVETVIEAIQSVAADTWEENGGLGSIQHLDAAHCLLCRQTRAVHEQVEAVLAKLRKAMPKRKPTPDDQLSLRVYTLSPFGFKGFGEEHDGKMFQEVAKLIEDLIAPKSWNAKGSKVFIRALPDRIIVRQTAKVHREIRMLLIKLGLYDDPRDFSPIPSGPIIPVVGGRRLAPAVAR